MQVIVKLRRCEDYIVVFVGFCTRFVGEGILWYSSNYTNKGGLGGCSPRKILNLKLFLVASETTYTGI